MQTTYRHVLVFGPDEEEAQKATNASQWLKQHVHMSGMHDPSCYVDFNCSFPEVVFFTSVPLNENITKSIIEACKPGSSGEVPPGNAEFNFPMQEHNPFVPNYQVLSNGLTTVRGRGVRVCLIQTEEPGKPEAWLFALENPASTSKYGWKYCSRSMAIAQINVWLEMIGLALQETPDDQLEIAEF